MTEALGQRLTLTVAGESQSDLGDAALAEKVELNAHPALAEGGSRGCTYALAHGAAAEVFVEVIPAPVQLFVFGGGQEVVPLAELASVLGWRTTVVVDRLGEAHSLPRRVPSPWSWGRAERTWSGSWQHFASRSCSTRGGKTESEVRLAAASSTFVT